MHGQHGEGLDRKRSPLIRFDHGIVLKAQEFQSAQITRRAERYRAPHFEQIRHYALVDPYLGLPLSVVWRSTTDNSEPSAGGTGSGVSSPGGFDAPTDCLPCLVLVGP